MDDINIVLWKKKQEKAKLKQQKEKVARLRYERQLKKEAAANEPAFVPKHQRFYESVFKNDEKDAKSRENFGEGSGDAAAPPKGAGFQPKKADFGPKNERAAPNFDNKKKRVFKKNRKGQPIMKYQIRNILDKISK